MATNPHQMYQKGDLVRIADAFPEYMSHFPGKGDRGIIIGSYEDRYGGSSPSTYPDYTVFIEDRGEVAWYPQSLMSLIEKGQILLLDVWKAKMETEKRQLRDLDFIFSKAYTHWSELPQTSAQALADETGIGSLWGSRGEGYVLLQNMIDQFTVLAPFLMKQDKEGFLAFARAYKAADKEGRRVLAEEHFKKYGEFYVDAAAGGG